MLSSSRVTRWCFLYGVLDDEGVIHKCMSWVGRRGSESLETLQKNAMNYLVSPGLKIFRTQCRTNLMERSLSDLLPDPRSVNCLLCLCEHDEKETY